MRIPIVYNGAWHKATAQQRRVISVILFIEVIRGWKEYEKMKEQRAVHVAGDMGPRAPWLE